MRQIGNQIDYDKFCKSFRHVSPNRFVSALSSVQKTEVIAFICDFIAPGTYRLDEFGRLRFAGCFQSSERLDCFSNDRDEFSSYLCSSPISEHDLFFRGFVTQLELFP